LAITTQTCLDQLRDYHYYTDKKERTWFQCCKLGQKAVKKDDRFYCQAEAVAHRGAGPLQQAQHSTKGTLKSPRKNASKFAQRINGPQAIGHLNELKYQIAACYHDRRESHYYTDHQHRLWFHCCAMGEKAVKREGHFVCQAPAKRGIARLESQVGS
jgi:hypothetical protein